jgi:PUA domain protein
MIKKRHPLSSKEQKELLKILKEKYSIDLDKKKIIEVVETKDEKKIYFQEGKPIAILIDENLIPTLKSSKEILDLLPKVIVDMGAVPHIVNGADIMAPGIKEIKNDAEIGKIVLIIDEKYEKPIAIGIMIMNSKEIFEKRKGKAIKNLHYVGDDLWKLM